MVRSRTTGSIFINEYMNSVMKCTDKNRIQLVIIYLLNVSKSISQTIRTTPKNVGQMFYDDDCSEHTLVMVIGDNIHTGGWARFEIKFFEVYKDIGLQVLFVAIPWAWIDPR